MFQNLLLASFSHYFFGITLTLTSVFLILLVLVQRGRGGGLAGAFGGMGGQSAFGTKAGDTFTRITIGVSLLWILLCLASVKILGTDRGAFGRATIGGEPQVQDPLGQDEEADTQPEVPPEAQPGLLGSAGTAGLPVEETPGEEGEEGNPPGPETPDTTTP